MQQPPRQFLTYSLHADVMLPAQEPVKPVGADELLQLSFAHELDSALRASGMITRAFNVRCPVGAIHGRLKYHSGSQRLVRIVDLKKFILEGPVQTNRSLFDFNVSLMFTHACHDIVECTKYLQQDE